MKNAISVINPHTNEKFSVMYKVDLGKFMVVHNGRNYLQDVDELRDALPKEEASPTVNPVPEASSQMRNLLTSVFDSWNKDPETGLSPVELVAQTFELMKQSGEFKGQLRTTDNGTKFVKVIDSTSNSINKKPEVRLDSKGQGQIMLVKVSDSGEEEMGYMPKTPEEARQFIERIIKGDESGVIEKVAEIDKKNNVGASNLPEEVTATLESNFDELAELHDADYPSYVKRLKDHANKHGLKFKDLNEHMKLIDKKKHGENGLLIQ